ncbi:MAG: bifunctional DNA-formamidopyrimidine glycosylase/DNA-(apurinic or apyrimidinic site) lyase [Candidatus Levybacteria bacterium]|nr:bifunctional DNA-formamidopyrimidine glycosylase/DNA-(apurinic or apyrimidinic site) lyase [Candidatus Levybacteria bacterium]
MPELPEVETLKLGLRKYLVGHTIKDIEVKVPKLFVGDKRNVIGAKVVDVKRIGKGLILELNNNYVLAVHLKMTGQLVYRDEKTKNLTLSVKVGGETLPSKYTHIIFKLKTLASRRSGQKSNLKTTRLAQALAKRATQNSKLQDESNEAFLYYNDLRQFGWIKVVKKDKVMQVPFFKEMGPEPPVVPLSGTMEGQALLTINKFREILQKSGLVVKVLLMDQKKIGGIGNIYANDALYKAGIDPRRKAKQISSKEADKLYDAILAVLKAGLEFGGSSDENFVNVLGEEGAYQNHFLIYGRKSEKCKKCGSIIQKIRLGGRGTYFCENCQR